MNIEHVNDYSLFTPVGEGGGNWVIPSTKITNIHF